MGFGDAVADARGSCWRRAALQVPALAHHSFSAEFEADKTAELDGKIVQVWWNNPHIRYRLQVTGEDGATEDWELQASSITAMQQLGWNATTLKVGDELKVSGQVGRNGAKKLYVRSIERPDGTRLVTGRGDSTGPDPNQVHATPGKNYAYGPARNDYPVDITGPWRNRYKFRVTVDDLEPKPTPFTAEGRALFAATDHYQDPALRCLALGLPRLFGAPYNMEIVDAGTHYVQIYVEHNTPRRIWMDGRQPPADTQPSSLGFSVGPLGRRRARHRDDPSVAGLARWLGVTDEGRGHAHRRALRARRRPAVDGSDHDDLRSVLHAAARSSPRLGPRRQRRHQRASELRSR